MRDSNPRTTIEPLLKNGALTTRPTRHIYIYTLPLSYTIEISLLNMEVHDCRLRFPFTWILTGGSGCGKTTKVLNFLKYHDILTTNPHCTNIIYCYNEWQSQFDSVTGVTRWYEGLPSMNEIIDMTEQQKTSSGTMLIIDDFGQHLNQSYGDLFTVKSHHRNCSVILLTQTLFDKNPVYRTISLNTIYLTVFKNPRDNNQITALAKQIGTTNAPAVVKIYHEVTEEPYSYLFVDCHQTTKKNTKYRINILPQEAPMRSFVPKEI